MTGSSKIRHSARLAATAGLAALSMLLQGSVGLRSNLDQRLLAAHNRERAAAGIPALHWNRALAADAAAWGAELTELGGLEHAPQDPYDPDVQGENLFAGTRGHFAPEAMVGMWIEEKEHFQPGIFPDNSRTGDYADVGHYTQLMWRDTRQVGCAVVPGDELDYLVCRYSAAGNVEGERPF